MSIGRVSSEFNRKHGLARAVERRQTQLAGSARRGEHAQRGKAVSVQAHAAERERQRQPGRLVRPLPQAESGVQGRVEQRGMDAEGLRVIGVPLVQRHLGEDLLAAPPGRPRPLEHGPVVEARL